MNPIHNRVVMTYASPRAAMWWIVRNHTGLRTEGEGLCKSIKIVRYDAEPNHDLWIARLAFEGAKARI
jgi:hypothetical protein